MPGFFRNREIRNKLIGGAVASLASSLTVRQQDADVIAPARLLMPYGVGLLAGVVGTAIARDSIFNAEPRDTTLPSIILLTNWTFAVCLSPYFNGDKMKARIAIDTVTMFLCLALAACIQPEEPNRDEQRRARPQ